MNRPFPAVGRAIRQLLRHYPHDRAARALWAVTVTPVSLADALQAVGETAAAAPRAHADFVFDAHPDLLDLDVMLDDLYRTDDT